MVYYLDSLYYIYFQNIHSKNVSVTLWLKLVLISSIKQCFSAFKLHQLGWIFFQYRNFTFACPIPIWSQFTMKGCDQISVDTLATRSTHVLMAAPPPPPTPPLSRHTRGPDRGNAGHGGGHMVNRSPDKGSIECPTENICLKPPAPVCSLLCGARRTVRSQIWTSVSSSCNWNYEVTTTLFLRDQI